VGAKTKRGGEKTRQTKLEETEMVLAEKARQKISERAREKVIEQTQIFKEKRRRLGRKR
jgi:hypothetical protein